MSPMLRKNFIFLFCSLSFFLILSCWDDNNSVSDPINNAPLWLNAEYRDSCAFNDTIYKDLELIGIDIDKDSLNYEIVDSVDSNFIFIDNNTLHVIGDVALGQLCSLKIVVSDGDLSDTALFIISFYTINHPPIWSLDTIRSSVIIGDTSITNLNIYAADIDSTDNLTYSIVNDTNSCDTIIDSLYRFVPDSSLSPWNVKVSVSDGEFSDTTVISIIVKEGNHAPTWQLDTVSNTITLGDSISLNLNEFSNDVDLVDELTYSIVNDINSCDTIIDSIFFLKPDTLLSPYNVLISVSDGILQDTALFTFTVSDSNHTPVWSKSTYIDSCKSGDSILINLNLLATDVDLDSLHFAFVDSLSQNGSSLENGYLKVKTPSDSSGSIVHEVIVSDGILTDTASFTINFKKEIIIINNPPKWSDSLYSHSVEKGKSFSIDLSQISSDPDLGDLLIFEIIDALDEIDTIESNIYKINPILTTTSPYVVRILVSDGELTDTAKFNFILTNPNFPPVFSNDNPKILYEIEEGDSVSIGVVATDLDIGDEVTIGISNLGDLPNPSNSSFNNGLFKWTSQTGDNGAYVITFFATDGKDTTLASTTVRVGEANIAPTITVSDTFSNGTALIDENDTLIINFTFEDLDADDNITVSHSIPEVTGLFFTKSNDNKSGTLKFSTTNNTVIDAIKLVLDTIKISVTDGEDVAMFPLVITVNNVNRLPYFNVDSPMSSYTIVAGNTLRIPFSADDPDSEDNPVITVDENSFKSGADISVIGSEIVWNTKLADIGSDEISLSVTDGEDVVNTSVNVIVNENSTAPTITIGNYSDGDEITVDEEGSASFTVSAEPALQGDQVTLSKVGNFNSEASFNESTGSFAFTPNYDMASQLNPDTVFSFTFSAKGSASNAQSSTFNIKIKVTNVNRKPVFDSIPKNSIVGVGNDYSATLIVSDPDGDNVTVTLSDDRLSYSAGKVTWHVDNKIYAPGTSIFANATISDGDESISSIQWEIRTGNHEWTEIMAFDSIVDVVASEKDSIFVFLPNHKVACFSSEGDEYSEKSFTTMAQPVPLPPFSLVQYSNKLFWHVQNGLNVYNINGTTLDSAGYYGQSYTPIKGAYVNESDETIIRDYKLVKASRKGFNAFSTEIFDEDTILVRAMSMAGDKPDWDTIHKGITFIDYEPASETGDVTYFIDKDNEIYITSEGTMPNPGYNGIEINKIVGAPTDVKMVSPLNDSTAWILTNSGAIHFSAHYFKNNNHYQEVVGNPYEVIKKVIVSEADDKRAIFAVTNKKIFMY